MSRNWLGRVAVVSLVGALLAVAPAWSQEAGDPPVGEPLPPQIILNTQKVPVYPPAAQAGRFGGSVMVEAAVGKDGKVGEVKIVECTRPKMGFEQAAIDAVKSWRFEPGRMGGEPVDYSLKFRLNFEGGGPGEVPRVSAGSFASASSGASADSNSQRSRARERNTPTTVQVNPR